MHDLGRPIFLPSGLRHQELTEEGLKTKGATTATAKPASFNLALCIAELLSVAQRDTSEPISTKGDSSAWDTDLRDVPVGGVARRVESGEADAEMHPPVQC